MTYQDSTGNWYDDMGNLVTGGSGSSSYTTTPRRTKRIVFTEKTLKALFVISYSPIGNFRQQAGIPSSAFFHCANTHTLVVFVVLILLIFLLLEFLIFKILLSVFLILVVLAKVIEKFLSLILRTCYNLELKSKMKLKKISVLMNLMESAIKLGLLSQIMVKQF